MAERGFISRARRRFRIVVGAQYLLCFSLLLADKIWQQSLWKSYYVTTSLGHAS